MRKGAPAPADPDAYVAGLTGWKRERVEILRAAVRAVESLDERVKWGHLVYLANGPVLLIRAEESRVLFGFWRGKRLIVLEPRLKPSGKYELANLVLREETPLDASLATRLAQEAANLNHLLGDPTEAVRQ